NDYDYYRYLYLGEAVGLGNNVYNMSTFHAIEPLPSDDKLIGISFALDRRTSTVSNGCMCFWYHS
ncbi:Phage terminase, large subunit, PBSX family, partial [human gut metagenome]